MEFTNEFPETDLYRIRRTIPVPHPYCIGPRHVSHAADHFGGILGKEAIESAERAGIHCETCKGQLSYEEHEQAALVEVKFDGELQDAPGLQEYLQECLPKVQELNLAGFAFVKGWK